MLVRVCFSVLPSLDQLEQDVPQPENVRVRGKLPPVIPETKKSIFNQEKMLQVIFNDCVFC